MPEHKENLDSINDKEIPTGERALVSFLEQSGKNKQFPGVCVRQLHLLLFFTEGYTMIPRDDHTRVTGPLNDFGISLVKRITSTSERIDYFVKAVIQSAYRAGRANRPDLIDLGPEDGSVVNDALEGRSYNPLPSLVIPEGEDRKVHELLIKAVEPVIIEGSAVVF